MPNPVPLKDILPELFTGTMAIARRKNAALTTTEIELCQWVQSIDPDSLSYPLMLTPGVWLKSPQAVARLQLEARWVLDYHKDEADRPPARFNTGALIKDLQALKEVRA